MPQVTGTRCRAKAATRHGICIAFEHGGVGFCTRGLPVRARPRGEKIDGEGMTASKEE